VPSVLPSPPGQTRIVIADDDPFFVQMLRAELAGCEQLEVVGTAANGAEAIDLVEELQPAVVLMDVAMPVLDGVDAMREIRNMPHPPAVVVITGREEEVTAHAAYQEGAQAYLRKSEDLPLLIGVIVAVSQLAAA
jgi:DNA-binding NarL/FixJ family response regulator